MTTTAYMFRASNRLRTNHLKSATGSLAQPIKLYIRNRSQYTVTSARHRALGSKTQTMAQQQETPAAGERQGRA